MLNNFTLQDIFGAALACALFALIFVAPGYVLGWLLDLFDFTRRTSAVRFVIAIVLSVAVSPIILFLVYHFTSAKTTILFLLLIGIVFSIILLKSKYASLPEEATSFYRTALLVAVGWIIFAILFIVDIQWGDRLYYNVISYDFTTRVAIVNAITRSGVPPINPSYYPGHPVRLTFLYYFWYIPCSLAAQIGSPFVSGYTAMIASVAWCGLALMATIALYLRLRNPAGGSSSTWKSSLLGIGLLLVSGLDVIPALLLIISSRVRYGYTFLNGDIEHWNEQITAWIGSVAWVPHHVAALIACLAALMLIHSVRGRRTSQQIKAGVIAGLAFASAVGLSVYVTLVFVLFWGIWMIVLFFQKERLLSLIMGLADHCPDCRQSIPGRTRRREQFGTLRRNPNGFLGTDVSAGLYFHFHLSPSPSQPDLSVGAADKLFNGIGLLPDRRYPVDSAAPGKGLDTKPLPSFRNHPAWDHGFHRFLYPIHIHRE